MAIHPDTASLIKEAIKEMIFAAENCITYRKDETWGANQAGGCLGYPGVLLLFSVVDTIGSFREGDKTYKITIDGKERTINTNNYEHYFILNSPYFKQNLSETIIKKIYQNFRNLLIHNLSLPPDHFLFMGALTNQILEIKTDDKGNQCPFINVISFLDMSKKAVAQFLQDVDAVVPSSKQHVNITSKEF